MSSYQNFSTERLVSMAGHFLNLAEVTENYEQLRYVDKAGRMLDVVRNRMGRTVRFAMTNGDLEMYHEPANA